MGHSLLREVNSYNKDAINRAAFMPDEPEEDNFFSSDVFVEKPAKKHTGRLVEVNKGNKAGINKQRENLFFTGGDSRADYANDMLFGNAGYVGDNFMGHNTLASFAGPNMQGTLSHYSGLVGADTKIAEANGMTPLKPQAAPGNFGRIPSDTQALGTMGNSRQDYAMSMMEDQAKTYENLRKITDSAVKKQEDARKGLITPTPTTSGGTAAYGAASVGEAGIIPGYTKQDSKDIAALGLTEYARKGIDIAEMDRRASRYFGADYGESGKTTADYIRKQEENPFSKMNIGKTAGKVGAMIGNIPTGERRGMFDTMDPLHHLAGGRESAAGNVMGDAGVGLFQAGAQSGNGYMMLAGAGLKVLGSLTNAAFGLKTNKQLLNAANESMATNRNFISNASYYDDIKGPAATTSSNIYKGGWFSGGKADEKNRAIAEGMEDAYQWADRSVTNNIRNIGADVLGNYMRNYAALGGYFDRSKRKKRLRKR